MKILRTKFKYYQLVNTGFGFSNPGRADWFQISAVKIKILLPPLSPFPAYPFSSSTEFANLSLVEMIKCFYNNLAYFLNPYTLQEQNFVLPVLFCSLRIFILFHVPRPYLNITIMVSFHHLIHTYVLIMAVLRGKEWIRYQL